MKKIICLGAILVASSFISVESTPLVEESNFSTTSSPPCARNGPDGGFLPNVIFPRCTASLEPASLRNMIIHGMACACDTSTIGVPKREDYVYTPGVGAHKLHTTPTTFNDARKICNEEGGHLAVIESLAEEQILMDLFKSTSLVDASAFLGIHDLYKEGEWVTILGDSLHKAGYSKWTDEWGGQPDNGGGVQNCGALRQYGGMDDVNCNVKYPFFCEISSIKVAY